jgi:hypothetical protein
MLAPMRKSLPLAVPYLALAAVAAFVPAACSKTPAVPGVTLDAGFALNAGDGGSPTIPGPSGSPMASTSSAPSASASTTASGSASAAPSGSAPALLAAGVDAALDAAIVAQAAKDAPGMTSEGSPGHETLQQGGHFGMVVTLQPGKCYTIIAMSAPLQVSELDVHLFMLPLNLESGHSPPTDKNPAVLGRGAQKTCPVSPIAVPYKVDVSARKGAGRIAVSVFSKSK